MRVRGQKAVFVGRGLCGVALGLLLTGACGGDDGSSGTSGPPVPLEDVPSLYANAFCGYFERCLGETLVEVSLLPDTLDTARRTWRRHVAAALLWIAGITILLLIGPVLDRRAQAPAARNFLRSTGLSLLLLAVGSAVIGVALA